MWDTKAELRGNKGMKEEEKLSKDQESLMAEFNKTESRLQIINSI